MFLRMQKICCFLFIYFSALTFVFSQATNNDTAKSTITDFKILKETKDKNGNFLREVQYKENGFTVIKTIIVPPFPSLTERKPVLVDTLDRDSLMIYVDKEQYYIAVIYKRQRIRQYRAVFGPDRTQDKMMMGDRMTPEGWFKIVNKRNHSEWQRFVLLDYPNKESIKKFNDRKAQGLIPANASIGHSVGIHGTFRGGEKMFDIGLGWTDGCVALKPNDMIDLYQFCFPGVRVYIAPIGSERENKKVKKPNTST